MFRASLRPSSGEQDRVLPHMVFCIGCACLWLCVAGSQAVCTVGKLLFCTVTVTFTTRGRVRSGNFLRKGTRYKTEVQAG